MKMMAISGGAGAVGSRLVEALRPKGRPLRVLTLRGDPNAARLRRQGVEIFPCDVSDRNSLRKGLDGVETVYHLAAVILARDASAYTRINVQGTANMLTEAASAGVSHFILVSSVAAVRPQASAYAASKARAEELVRSQTPMRFTIVRPTLVYDRSGGQEFLMFLDYLKRYPLIPFVGGGRAMKNPVYVEDLVQGLAAIAGNPVAYGKTYHLSGGEAISIRALARLLLAHLGLRKPFISIPLPVCRLAAFFMEQTLKNPPLTRYAISRIEEDADPDNSVARRDLGYRPIGIREGLGRCFPLHRRP